ncbi:PilZ domain-containing protein [Erythrobacter sp.]|uniref:PilZ domain-containing protein n=1 Tax=Erythrobacter sp. TaxID=1042 RepID=UPI0025DAD585|nr:PilZ domain-containing protein [Erythrobacter sp.]
MPAHFFSDESGDDRGYDRFRIRLGAVRVEVGADVSDVTVHDVSVSGILLETEQRLAAGVQIVFAFPDSFRCEARIVWASNDFYGAEFTEGLSPADLTRIYAASQIVWPKFKDEEPSDFADLRQDPDIVDTPPSDALEHDRDPRTVDDADKLPLPTRLKIIFGMASLSWAIIGGGVWLAFG